MGPSLAPLSPCLGPLPRSWQPSALHGQSAPHPDTSQPPQAWPFLRQGARGPRTLALTVTSWPAFPTRESAATEPSLFAWTLVPTGDAALRCPRAGSYLPCGLSGHGDPEQRLGTLHRRLPPCPCMHTSRLISPSWRDILPPPGKVLACSPNQQGKLQPPRPSPHQMEITYSCRGGGGGREQNQPTVSPSVCLSVCPSVPGASAAVWALTALVLLDDIHHLPGLQAQLRVLLLLIVGHHHVLFQDHGLGVGVGTWRGQKARGEPAAGHGPAAGAPPVHRPRGRLFRRQRRCRSKGPPAARARSSPGPKDRPYSKAPHRPAAPRGPGDMGSWAGVEGGGTAGDERRPWKLRGRACRCDESVTARHERAAGEAWCGRGLPRPLGRQGRDRRAAHEG